nr:MAG TPA: hypothetical protein [Bacteriophage sp.]
MPVKSFPLSSCCRRPEELSSGIFQHARSCYL